MLDLVRCEHIIFSFHTIAVRVLTAVAGQLPQDILRRPVGHICIPLQICVLISIYISDQQQGVIIEHFLKVRYQPFFVCGIPRETASNVILKPATRHGVQSDFHQLYGLRLFGCIGIAH